MNFLDFCNKKYVVLYAPLVSCQEAILAVGMRLCRECGDCPRGQKNSGQCREVAITGGSTVL